jgi:ANTAR domain
MNSRRDRDDAGVQPRTGPVGVPGNAPDSTTSDAGTGPFQAVERTPDGWRVGDEELPDLTSAMVLADILNAELTADEQAELDATGASAPPPPAPPAGQQDGRNSGLTAGAQPPAAPAREYPSEPRGRRASRRGAHRAGSRGMPADRAETEQLKQTVAQLERALTVRVRVEQAIGILAERHRIRPRQAFELLRSASRARGQRIMETASQVIASATNPLLRLPDELAKPPMPRRMPRRSRGEA